MRLKLRYFLRYAADTPDDSPLYVFDGSFADRNGTATLLDDYTPPKYFRDDLFHLAGERRRPPYRCVHTGTLTHPLCYVARCGTMGLRVTSLDAGRWACCTLTHHACYLAGRGGLLQLDRDRAGALWDQHSHRPARHVGVEHAPPRPQAVRAARVREPARTRPLCAHRAVTDPLRCCCRWVLFPPSTPKAALQTPKGESEAATWFAKVYPRTRVRPST